MSCLRSSPILKMSLTGVGEMDDLDIFFSSSHIGSFLRDGGRGERGVLGKEGTIIECDIIL